MTYLEIDPRMRGKLTRHFLPLYNDFAGEPRMALRVPAGFEQVMKLLYGRHGLPEPRIQAYPLELEWEQGSGEEVIVAFSGGLDSAYKALQLADEGSEVTLYHVTGLNKAFPDEDRHAAEFARAAGMELVECRVRHQRSQKYIDNPLKNQLVLALMADYGLGRGVTRYAMGADWCTGIDECEVGYTITDSRELNEAFLEGMRKMVPPYSMEFIDGGTKKAQRLDYIAERHPECLRHVASCITPHRFKRKLHDGNEAKYGVALMEGRCGSCFKCCMEWLLLRRLGRAQENDAFERHCWDVLANGTNSHRPDLFGNGVPMVQRERNLMEYGS